MKEIRLDFSIDIITNEKIDKSLFLEKLKKNNKKRNYYTSEIADLYYQEKYKKNIIEIISQYYEIPKCPITNDFVTYRCLGFLKIGTYSKKCSQSQISKHVAENNENFKNSIEKLKKERKGKGNPMFGKIPWNKGLTANESDSVKNISLKKTGQKPSEETKNKQSESAKKRKFHGHTGKKHTEESKQKMREKTIMRFKNGLFPKTKTVPHNLFKKILDEFDLKYEEEFEYGIFIYDFLLVDYNILIEINGDYFHCNPKTKYKIPKYEVQIKNVKRDGKKKNFVLKEKKYKLKYFWELDFNKNIKKIEKWIKNLKK
jgi:G:T-mismatch repair DNA endonuclease (very short patch repair protein)